LTQYTESKRGWGDTFINTTWVRLLYVVYCTNYISQDKRCSSRSTAQNRQPARPAARSDVVAITLVPTTCLADWRASYGWQERRIGQYSGVIEKLTTTFSPANPHDDVRVLISRRRRWWGGRSTFPRPEDPAASLVTGGTPLPLTLGWSGLPPWAPPVPTWLV